MMNKLKLKEIFKHIAIAAGVVVAVRTVHPIILNILLKEDLKKLIKSNKDAYLKKRESNPALMPWEDHFGLQGQNLIAYADAYRLSLIALVGIAGVGIFKYVKNPTAKIAATAGLAFPAIAAVNLFTDDRIIGKFSNFDQIPSTKASKLGSMIPDQRPPIPVAPSEMYGGEKVIEIPLEQLPTYLQAAGLNGELSGVEEDLLIDVSLNGEQESVLDSFSLDGDEEDEFEV